MYILPKNDKDFENLCEQQKFRGRHQVIMEIRKYFCRHETIDLETFVKLITKYNQGNWPSWD